MSPDSAETTLALSESGQMPAVGLGTWKIPEDRVAGMVHQAIRLGWRHLDCACDYGNEAGVGDGIARALDDGLCQRDDLWVTSKLWTTYHRPEHVRLACERSLKDLQLDALDLYLVHFPIALEFVPFEERYPPGWAHDPAADPPVMKPVPIPLAETWTAMEALVDAGLVRHIGLCNVPIALLRELATGARIRPACLQVELHPFLTQEKLLRYCRQEAIAVCGFSPLGALSYAELGTASTDESVLELPIVHEIASRHARTPAQIVLRWGLQRGTAIIPKTSKPERLEENLALFDFRLSDDEMQAISALDRGRRFNDPGVFCEAGFGTFFPIYD